MFVTDRVDGVPIDADDEGERPLRNSIHLLEQSSQVDRQSTTFFQLRRRDIGEENADRFVVEDVTIFRRIRSNQFFDLAK